MSRAMIEANEVITLRADHTVRPLHSFNPTRSIDDICRVSVPDAAAVLDEHVPGWHQRITRPLVMESVDDCVFGQVFGDEPGSRRFFGLLPPKKCEPGSLMASGYLKGRLFFEKRGLDDRPFVFSSPQAAPYWGAEISRRST